jgi:hypothetical protein
VGNEPLSVEVVDHELALAFVSAVFQAFRLLRNALPAIVGAPIVLIGLGCGGSSGTVGAGAPSGANPAGGSFFSAGTAGGNAAPSGSNLVLTCDNICNNVVATCVSPPLSPDAYMQCINACQYLNLVQSTCVADFAGYLGCLAGANSVSCSGNGQYVVVSPPTCEEQRNAYADCVGGPPLAACIEIAQTSTSCAAHAPRNRALICVGVPPPDCDSTGGLLGPYCCP